MATKVSYEQQDEIRQLLVGRTVVKVDEDTLRLDDGTTLTIHGNYGCGGCSNGNYLLTELNDSPVNAITAVTFDLADSERYDDDESFRVFVLAQDERIKLLEVEGHDNGYYGVGYWIDVVPA